MEPIRFSKLSGCGNDFIIIDNRAAVVPQAGLSGFVRRVCARKMSVGADGLILIEPSMNRVDFRWRFFNADGTLAEMCGNGARCAARFAYLNRIAGAKMAFETEAGVIRAEIDGEGALLEMPEPKAIQRNISITAGKKSLTGCSLNTGVPHLVLQVDDIEGVDVEGLGREIRFHKMFSPAGTNVNFIGVGADRTLINRTYERGVEAETLACGTGSLAAAIVMALEAGWESPIKVKTRSGRWLTFHFRQENDRFFDILMEGDARLIYTGELTADAWNW